MRARKILVTLLYIHTYIPYIQYLLSFKNVYKLHLLAKSVNQLYPLLLQYFNAPFQSFTLTFLSGNASLRTQKWIRLYMHTYINYIHTYSHRYFHLVVHNTIQINIHTYIQYMIIQKVLFVRTRIWNMHMYIHSSFSKLILTHSYTVYVQWQYTYMHTFYSTHNKRLQSIAVHRIFTWRFSCVSCNCVFNFVIVSAALFNWRSLLLLLACIVKFNKNQSFVWRNKKKNRENR